MVTCFWGQGDIPSAPLFISKGKVVCTVFLNLKLPICPVALWTCCNWQESFSYMVWELFSFGSYGRILFWNIFLYFTISVVYRLAKYAYFSKCWGVIQDLQNEDLEARFDIHIILRDLGTILWGFLCFDFFFFSFGYCSILVLWIDWPFTAGVHAVGGWRTPSV